MYMYIYYYYYVRIVFVDLDEKLVLNGQFTGMVTYMYTDFAGRDIRTCTCTCTIVIQRLYFVGLNFRDFHKFDDICENISSKILTLSTIACFYSVFKKLFQRKCQKQQFVEIKDPQNISAILYNYNVHVLYK